MSLIDQRILIVAPADAVWLHLTDPALLSKWHRGCQQISILTTRPTGVGARRRCIDERGRATIEEITAWLENLGCEYKMVDGPYRTYRARVRLQVVPEGTIVNWIIEYQLRGPLTRLRNALGVRRGIERLMIDSLKRLRRLVENSGIQLDREKQARVAMQAGPDAAARAARAAEIIRTEGTPPNIASQPVVIDDDDLPEIAPMASIKPATTGSPTIIHQSPGSRASRVVSAQAEPDFVAKLTQEAPSTVADTKPRRPQGLSEAIRAAQTMKPVDMDQITDSASMRERDADEHSHNALTVPIALVAPPPAPEPVTQTLTMPPVKQPETLPERLPTPPFVLRDSLKPQAEPAPEDPLNPSPIVPPPTDKHDTGEISIWDVFGQLPPSERAKAELEAVIASLQTSVSLPAETPTSPKHRPMFTRSKAKPNVRTVAHYRKRIKSPSFASVRRYRP